MDKNVDQGSAVECTAAHPCLTKSPEEEEKSLYVFSVLVLILASVKRFDVSSMRDSLSWTFQIVDWICLGDNRVKMDLLVNQYKQYAIQP